MNELIKRTLCNYYNVSANYFKIANLPEQYSPNNWVTKTENIAIDFAKYIQFALTEVDNNKMKYAQVMALAGNYYYFCIVEKEIFFREIAKENGLLDYLWINSMHELDEIGNKYCNTSRKAIDLVIGLILDRENAIKIYEKSDIDWDLICVADLFFDKRALNYVLQCLHNTDNVIYIEQILYALQANQFQEALEVIEQYIDTKLKIDFSVQSSLIEYLCSVQCNKSIELLESLKERGVLFEENQLIYQVAFSKLKYGEDGLIKLYYNSDSYSQKSDIISCYRYYRSKKFAKLLIEALDDETRLENGYCPIIHDAYYTLKRESFVKLIDWFGAGILEVMEEKRKSCKNYI